MLTKIVIIFMLFAIIFALAVSLYFLIKNQNDNNQTVNYSFTNIGTYPVILVASNGICTDSALVNITVLPFPDPIIYIPNVFTPNGDSVNDVFIAPKPYEDWILVNFKWEAPIPYPSDDQQYFWNDNQWNLINI